MYVICSIYVLLYYAYSGSTKCLSTPYMFSNANTNTHTLQLEKPFVVRAISHILSSHKYTYKCWIQNIAQIPFSILAVARSLLYHLEHLLIALVIPNSIPWWTVEQAIPDGYRMIIERTIQCIRQPNEKCRFD